ncbi:small integral membrane protein 8 isoform 1-T2 [Trichechus inunguis]
MSSAPEPPAFKSESPKEKDFRNPGLRGVRTTTLFRAVNPELFIKPNMLIRKEDNSCNQTTIVNFVFQSCSHFIFFHRKSFSMFLLIEFSYKSAMRMEVVFVNY